MRALRSALACLLFATGAAFGQGYPAKPVHLVVPFPPLGGNDVFARIVAQQLTEAWRQQVLVENRPGAGGSLGTEYVAKAAPDGYTLLLGHTGTLAINPALYKNIGYDTLRDFAPIALLASAPLVLVASPDTRIHTVSDLIKQAKVNPEKLTIASAGNGTGSHFTAELLQNMAGIKLTHVPYKGSSPALTDLLGGQVQMMFSVIPPVLPQINAGKLRPIAVTSASRIPQLQRIPTVAESGLPGFESTLAYGILAPNATPASVIDEIHTRIARITAMRDYGVRVGVEGAVVLKGTPAEFAALIKAQSEKWGKLIRAAGIKPE